MKKIIFTLSLILAFAHQASAFCGFYVAKADATLFNKSSQVIMVRDGNITTITMSNDFQGEVKDFAMVVPVPVVLKKEQIKTVNAALFAKTDAATAPRMSAYYDDNPCQQYVRNYRSSGALKMSAAPSMNEGTRPRKEKDLGVKIEAKYAVGEYDILILSAKESSGLETWLIQNGYKIPTGAKEVLDPYIKSNLKFFVVKVNLDRHESSGFTGLTPLQITFESNRFMLPIRLGMANADGDQDLIVYTFTRSGRVEPTNYRMAEMPHDRNVPLFVQNDFGKFYKDAFDVNWKRQGKNAVMLEYAWDISGEQPVKCDPCPSPPLTYDDLKMAGVDWVEPQNAKWGNGLYLGDLFVTRMHVRYNRSTFPQDLAFQTTPNQTRFQCRYVVHNPAYGDLSCAKGQEYVRMLIKRRQGELKEMASIAGWSMAGHDSYIEEYAHHLKNGNGVQGVKDILPVSTPTPPSGDNTGKNWPLGIYWLIGLSLIIFAAGARWVRVRG